MGRGRTLESDIDQRGLGEYIERNVHFPTAGIPVLIATSQPYNEAVPTGQYRVRVIQGDRRAVIRLADEDYDYDSISFVCNTSDVWADIAIQY